jgi:hypothetical protein
MEKPNIFEYEYTNRTTYYKDLDEYIKYIEKQNKLFKEGLKTIVTLGNTSNDGEKFLSDIATQTLKTR